MRVALLTLAVCLAIPMAASAQTYTYAGPPVPIPDRPATGCDGNDPGPDATVTINVADNFLIDSVDEVRLNITHSWIGDLWVSLSHGGTTVVIADKPGTPLQTSCGSSSDNMIMFVSDSGLDGTVENGPFPYNPAGTYIPNEALSAFAGMNVNGDWTLTVRDSGGGDTGTVIDWAFTVMAVPVELTAFNAVANGSDVTLAWATASETNNAGFEVQMRQGGDWSPLGFVAGHGTTTEAQTYSYTAAGLDPGTYTFRLKQVDFDGAFEYSGEVEATVEVVGTHVLTQAYPNPFNPQASFALTASQSQRVVATLYNALGQRVAVLFDGSVEANVSQTVQIDGAGLASGLYVVRVEGERFADALRVTLLK